MRRVLSILFIVAMPMVWTLPQSLAATSNAFEQRQACLNACVDTYNRGLKGTPKFNNIRRCQLDCRKAYNRQLGRPDADRRDR